MMKIIVKSQTFFCSMTLHLFDKVFAPLCEEADEEYVSDFGTPMLESKLLSR